MNSKHWFFLSLLIVGACHHESDVHTDNRVVQMPEISKDIRLPTKMWDSITGASFEKSVHQAANFIFAPMSVRLEEKTPGVLSDNSIRFEFPKGGGEIDFAKYVKGDRGSFKVHFDFEGLSEPETLQIFYVSKARKRRLDGEVYGSGCKVFYDVKDYLQKVNPQEGLVVNVTRDRHDSAIGGHFVFSYKKDNQTFVSEVTFTDSKRADLFCEALE